MAAVEPLLGLCLSAACRSDAWRFQKATVRRLPGHVASRLLQRLIQERRVTGPLLEVFECCVERLELGGQRSPEYANSWLSYISQFRCLRSLTLQDCRPLTDAALIRLSSLRGLQELSLSGCPNVHSSSALRAALALSLSSLSSLDLCRSGFGGDAAQIAADATGLVSLRMGWIDLHDSQLAALTALTRLTELEAWGSSSLTAASLPVLGSSFPALRHLHLAWTSIPCPPLLSPLTYLNLSGCTLTSLTCPLPPMHLLRREEENGAAYGYGQRNQYNQSRLDISPGAYSRELDPDPREPTLRELHLVGASLGPQSQQDLLHSPALRRLTLLDASGATGITECPWLGSLRSLRHLNLSSLPAVDDAAVVLLCSTAEAEAQSGSTSLAGTPCTEPGSRGGLPIGPPPLGTLLLSNTAVTSSSLRLLPELARSLTVLSLAGTAVDDAALPWLARLTGLTALDLSGTGLTGVYFGAVPDSSLEALGLGPGRENGETHLENGEEDDGAEGRAEKEDNNDDDDDAEDDSADDGDVFQSNGGPQVSRVGGAPAVGGVPQVVIPTDLSVLRALRNLRSLNLLQTRVDARGVGVVVRTLKSLQDFRVSSTAVFLPGRLLPAIFEGLPGLRHLALRDASVSPKMLRSLRSLPPFLERLDLANCPHVEGASAELAHLFQLSPGLEDVLWGDAGEGVRSLKRGALMGVGTNCPAADGSKGTELKSGERVGAGREGSAGVGAAAAATRTLAGLSVGGQSLIHQFAGTDEWLRYSRDELLALCPPDGATVRLAIPQPPSRFKQQPKNSGANSLSPRKAWG